MNFARANENCTGKNGKRKCTSAHLIYYCCIIKSYFTTCMEGETKKKQNPVLQVNCNISTMYFSLSKLHVITYIKLIFSNKLSHFIFFGRGKNRITLYVYIHAYKQNKINKTIIIFITIIVIIKTYSVVMTVTYLFSPDCQISVSSKPLLNIEFTLSMLE